MAPYTDKSWLILNSNDECGKDSVVKLINNKMRFGCDISKIPILNTGSLITFKRPYTNYNQSSHFTLEFWFHLNEASVGTNYNVFLLKENSSNFTLKTLNLKVVVDFNNDSAPFTVTNSASLNQSNWIYYNISVNSIPIEIKSTLNNTTEAYGTVLKKMVI